MVVFLQEFDRIHHILRALMERKQRLLGNLHTMPYQRWARVTCLRISVHSIRCLNDHTSLNSPNCCTHTSTNSPNYHMYIVYTCTYHVHSLRHEIESQLRQLEREIRQCQQQLGPGLEAPPYTGTYCIYSIIILQ